MQASAGDKHPTSANKDTYKDRSKTTQQAQTGYQKVATMLPDEQKLGERYGTSYTQADAENEMVGGLASAARKRTQLEDQEKAQFDPSQPFDPRGIAGATPGSY